MLDIGWRSEVEMPATFVETEILKDVVWAACRAPSLHNIQPWQWVLAGDRQLQLFPDPDDPTHLASIHFTPMDHVATIRTGSPMSSMKTSPALPSAPACSTR